ncbi:hypothetical protein [uncultured Brevundimonas sp.]|uniref:hypothetical protein n=1 Tax=uncultured Brevundimonas sp. TaxID=213418 RepID=UPI0030EE9432|tara:strand:+ start:36512 stop:37018 length:507 start_codon:yes stop_codon:yes gene_type:complete
MMMIVFLSLLAGSPPQSEQALLRSCEMTPDGWICVYRIPPITAVPERGSAVAEVAPEMGMSVPPSTMSLPAPSIDPIALEESRLIRRCAEASWLSLCTPGERRQARLLRDAANLREALRRDVTRLLSEQQCDAAVRTALRGGDLDLAREARAFCAAGTSANSAVVDHE